MHGAEATRHRWLTAVLEPARLSTRTVLCLLALAGSALLGWQGVTTAGRWGPIDGAEYRLNAQVLDRTGHLPSHAVSYEYASPPLSAALTVAAERTLPALPSIALEPGPNWLTRLLWLGLLGAGLAALTRPAQKLRRAGAVGVSLSVLWGVDESLSLARTAQWSGGQLLSLGSALGLIAVTGLIAREVWPDKPGRWLGAATTVAAYPVVYRMAIILHPELPFAFLCALALLVLLRAHRLGWPTRAGWLLGLALAAAADTRQPAVVVIACAVLWALVTGRRAARPVVLRATLVVVLLAGPWWGYAAWRWHNPLQSNLEPRASLMLDHQPLSFYLSFPLHDLILHPYRPNMAGQLLPQLHAELWSDWFGALHPFIGRTSAADRITASTQSALGLPADLLALGALLLAGLPASAALLRGRRERAPLALLSLVTAAALAAFVLELIRFPQRYGDPIKSSYLLFTAPCWAILLVTGWCAVRSRSRRAGVALAALAVLYAASYGASLAAGLTHPYPPLLRFAEQYGAPALVTTIQPLDRAPKEGDHADFAIWVANPGTATAGAVHLHIGLAASMQLTGPPEFERGVGCTGTHRLDCTLGFLPAGMSTPIRFEVQLTAPGAATVSATAVSATVLEHPETAATSVTLVVLRRS